jgi:acyl-coenzyme A thioesterase PaaI-like protein
MSIQTEAKPQSARVEAKGASPRDAGVNWARTLELWAFSAAKLPMLFYLRPQILHLDQESVSLRVRLSRRAKNHYGTMYFGALATGADAVPGIFASVLARKEQLRVSFVMKTAQAEFLRPARSDVTFTSNDGRRLAAAIQAAKQSGKPVLTEVTIEAQESAGSEVYARFRMEMSIKVK